MSRSIRQHSYVPFTGKPYIHYNGIPYQRNNDNNYNEHSRRTIVRTNELDQKIIPSVPTNGMDGVRQLVGSSPARQNLNISGNQNAWSNYGIFDNPNIQLQRSNINGTNDDAWSQLQRKDNIFQRYQVSSSRQNNLFC